MYWWMGSIIKCGPLIQYDPDDHLKQGGQLIPWTLNLGCSILTPFLGAGQIVFLKFCLPSDSFLLGRGADLADPLTFDDSCFACEAPQGSIMAYCGL